MNNQITINLEDYNEYMSLLSGQIGDLRDKYKELQNTINNWNDRFNPTSKTSGLTIEEMKGLQKNFKELQHKTFIKWYELNKQLRNKNLPHYDAERQRRLGDQLIGVNSYKDIL